MSRTKTERYCEEFNKNVIVTVHYTVAVTLGGSGAVLIGIECSDSPNGRCGECNTCHTLKEAQNDVRNNVM